MEKSWIQKNKILLFSILISGISFWEVWFGSKSFIVYGTLFLLLAAAYVICSVMAVKNLIKRPVVFKDFLTLLILIGTLLICYWMSETNMRIKWEMQLYEKPRMEVIQQLESGRGNVETNQLIPLSSKYKRICSDGHVIVYENTADKMVVGFYEFRGMLDAGYSVLIYTSDGREETARETTGYFQVSKLEKLQANWFYMEVDVDPDRRNQG